MSNLVDRVALIIMARDELITKADAIWLAEGIVDQLNLNQEIRYIGLVSEYRYATPWKTA